MQLSTKGRYAVMAMADLAGRPVDRPVTLSDIATRQQISLAYLEQLFSRLRRRGVIDSVRGPGGGYRLARSAEMISVADVVLAVDEPLKATRCAGKGSTTGCMVGGVRCLTHDLWEATGQHIEKFLAGISLADVVNGNLAARRGALA